MTGDFSDRLEIEIYMSTELILMSSLRVLLFKVSLTIIRSGEFLTTRWIVASECAPEMNGIDVTPKVFI